jgi:hypothetical protein
VPNAVPVECRFGADVQPLHATLEQSQAGVQFKRSIRSNKYPTSETREPTRTHVVDGEIGGHAQGYNNESPKHQHF